MAEEKTLHRFTGNKQPGDRTRRIVLEGPPDTPERFIDLNGEPAELTADEVEQYKARHTLAKLTDDQIKKYREEQGKSSGEPTRAQQQAAQAEAADAQGPGAETSQVSRTTGARRTPGDNG